MSIDGQWTRFVRAWKVIARLAHKDHIWSDSYVLDLLTRHHLPWQVDQDWTYEVVATDGQCVATFMHAVDAEDYVKKAQELAKVSPSVSTP